MFQLPRIVLDGHCIVFNKDQEIVSYNIKQDKTTILVKNTGQDKIMDFDAKNSSVLWYLLSSVEKFIIGFVESMKGVKLKKEIGPWVSIFSFYRISTMTAIDW